MRCAFSVGVPLFSGKCRSYTSNKQAELACEREIERMRYLFAADRRQIAPRPSVRVNQWSHACNLQYAWACTLTRAQKFSSRRVRLRWMHGRFYKFAGVGFCYGHYRLHANARRNRIIPKFRVAAIHSDHVYLYGVFVDSLMDSRFISMETVLEINPVFSLLSISVLKLKDQTLIA